MNALKFVTCNLFYSFFISMLLAQILQLLHGQTLHNFIDILECFQQTPASSPFQLSWSSLVCYIWFGSSFYLLWFIILYVMFGLDVLYLVRINKQKRNSLVFVWSRGRLLYALQARLVAINLFRLIAKKPELASLQHHSFIVTLNSLAKTLFVSASLITNQLSKQFVVCINYHNLS